jgi:hypothetical protein
MISFHDVDRVKWTPSHEDVPGDFHRVRQCSTVLDEETTT